MSPQPYKYGGAEALVALHAKHLREFWAIWQRADEAGVDLPASSDPSYVSREALLQHVMRAAAGYLVWICEQMEIPAPELDEKPERAGFAGRAGDYMEHVLAAWDLPLRELTEELADSAVYAARWGTPYSIDAMLEHAVMHPIRHGYQLERLMGAQ